jgi:transcriptional regulator with XRE-family HTH domain
MGPTLAGAMPRKKQPQTEFGEKLVALRRQRGLTQVQLSEASGITQRAISYYETMPGYPAAPAIIALAKALRVSSDELLGLKPLPRAVAAVQQPEERRLWKQFRRVAALPERDQRAVLRLINSVASAADGRRSA